MRKRQKQKLITGFLMGGAAFALATGPVTHADEDTVKTEDLVRTSVEASTFDYQKYSKASLEEAKSAVEKKEAKSSGDEEVIYHKWSAEIEHALQSADEDGAQVDATTVLESRAEHENKTTDAEKPAEVIREELSVEADQIRKEEENKAREAEAQRQEEQARQEELEAERARQEAEEKAREAYEASCHKQTLWSAMFLSAFDGRPAPADESIKDDFTVPEIAALFPDKEYTAPVEDPSLKRITEGWHEENPGITISVKPGEKVFSIGNNGTVLSAEAGTLTVDYDGHCQVVYSGLTSKLKTGDRLNKKDAIGQAENSRIHLNLVQNGMSLACDWLLSEYPFIPEKVMGMPLYLQTDPVWKDRAYGGSTIDECGCGPSALAMAASALTEKILTPADVVEAAGGAQSAYWTESGSTWSFMDEMPVKLGLKVRRISSGKVTQALKNDHPVIAIMGPGEFTNGGHFITLSGLSDGGTIYVNDSFDDKEKRHYEKSFSLDSIVAENAGAFWEIWQ